MANSNNVFDLLKFDEPFDSVTFSDFEVGNTTSVAQAGYRSKEDRTKIKNAFIVIIEPRFSPTGRDTKIQLNSVFSKLIVDGGQTAQRWKGQLYRPAYNWTGIKRDIPAEPMKWFVPGYKSIPVAFQKVLRQYYDRALGQNPSDPPYADERLLPSTEMKSNSPQTRTNVTTYTNSTSLELNTGVTVSKQGPELNAGVAYTMSTSKQVNVPSINITNYSVKDVHWTQFNLTTEQAQKSTFSSPVQYGVVIPDNGQGNRALDAPLKDVATVLIEVVTLSMSLPAPPPLTKHAYHGLCDTMDLYLTANYIRARRPQVPA